MTRRFPRPSSTRVVAALGVATGIALAILLVAANPDLLAAMSRPEQVRSRVIQAGAWGPAVFVALQVLQVVIAPIPGQATALAGGFLFGTFWGVVYTTLGALIGFTLLFVLTRWLGRPSVERIVTPSTLARFDGIFGEHGPALLFLIFLLPGFPDDVVSVVAGLTPIRVRTLILISLAGRLPGYVVLSATGSGFVSGDLRLMVLVVIFLVAVGAIAYWKRTRLEKMVRRVGKFLSGSRAPLLAVLALGTVAAGCLLVYLWARGSAVWSL